MIRENQSSGPLGLTETGRRILGLADIEAAMQRWVKCMIDRLFIHLLSLLFLSFSVSGIRILQCNDRQSTSLFVIDRSFIHLLSLLFLSFQAFGFFGNILFYQWISESEEATRPTECQYLGCT